MEDSLAGHWHTISFSPNHRSCRQHGIVCHPQSQFCWWHSSAHIPNSGCPFITLELKVNATKSGTKAVRNSHSVSNDVLMKTIEYTPLEQVIDFKNQAGVMEWMKRKKSNLSLSFILFLSLYLSRTRAEDFRSRYRDFPLLWIRNTENYKGQRQASRWMLHPHAS